MHVNRLVATVAMLPLLASCGSDGTTAPTTPRTTPAPALSVALDSTTLQGGALFTARLRGPRLDSLKTLTIAGVAAVGGLTDSTLVAVLPAGPAGTVPLVVEVWTGDTTRSATVALTRRPTAVVADVDAVITATQTDLATTLADLEGRTPAAGVSAEAYEAQLAGIRVLQDSLATMLAGFSAEERRVFAELLAGFQAIESSEAGFREAFNSESCSSFTWLGARECLRRVRETLTGTSLSTQKKLAYSVGMVAIGVAAATAAPVVATATIAIGIYSGIKNRQELADFTTAKVEAIFAPAIIDDLLLGDSDLQSPFATASAHGGSLTLIPGTPETLPLVRVSRNAVLADSTLPLVAPIPPIVQGLKSYWQQLEEIWGFSVTPTPPFPTQALRELRETPALGELSVVTVREAGAPATGVQATLLQVPDGIALQLDGDPGEGRDLVVTLRVDGEDAGAATRDLAVHFEAPPDTLEWAVATLTNGTWSLFWEIGTPLVPVVMCPIRQVFTPSGSEFYEGSYRPGGLTAESERTDVYDAPTNQEASAVSLSHSFTCEYENGERISQEMGVGYLYWLESEQQFRVLRLGAAGDHEFLELSAGRFAFQYRFNGEVEQRFTFTR